MRDFLKTVIVFLVSLCFSIAVLEIDTIGYDHTFFDSCDTYVQSSNSESTIVCPAVKAKDGQPITIVFPDHSLFQYKNCTRSHWFMPYSPPEFAQDKLCLKIVSLRI